MMITKLITICIWLTTLLGMPNEKYYITFVKGNVMLEKTKKAVKVGDALNPEDKLIFPNKEAKVSCVSPGKGRFDITGQTIKAGSKGELLALLKSSLVPSSGTYHLSTRSLMFEGYDPSSYFTSTETNGRILLIQNEPLVMKSAYKLDEKNFFFVQYNSNGKTIVRKVPQDENGIKFSNELFITESGSLIERVNLCYQTNASGSARSAVIANFSPVMATKNEIQDQVNLISEYMDKTDKKKLKTELAQHLFDNYGKIAPEEINRLFGL